MICELYLNKTVINFIKFKTKMLYNIMYAMCDFLKKCIE